MGKHIYLFVAEVYVPETGESMEVTGGIMRQNGTRTKKEIVELGEYIVERIKKRFKSGEFGGTDVDVVTLEFV